MDTSQLKRGILELCALAILEKHDCYGYQLVKIISNTINITDGTIYPLLKRIKDEGYVDTYLVESNAGPSRKFYRLTKTGLDELHDQKKTWIEFANSVDRLLEKGGLYE